MSSDTAQPSIVAGATAESGAAVGPVEVHGRGPYSRTAGRVKQVRTPRVRRGLALGCFADEDSQLGPGGRDNDGFAVGQLGLHLGGTFVLANEACRCRDWTERGWLQKPGIEP